MAEWICDVQAEDGRWFRSADQMIPVAYDATFERVFYLSRVARALQRPYSHLVHFAAARARVQTAGPAFARLWETGRMKLTDAYPLNLQSAQRRVEKECVSTCRSLGSPAH